MSRILLLITLVCAGSSAQVRFEDILKGPGENWLTYSGSYNGWRYAPGRQITPENAGSLVPKWIYHVPDARAMQTTPIVYQGVMYVTNGNNVYALDARVGRLIWKYSDARAARQGTNRGVGILGDRIYFTSADIYLTALDRRNGAVIFSKKFGSASDGVTSTAPVFIAKDKILIGTSGGDSGIRGSVAALSASTGEELWRTYTIPAKGEPGSETWGGYLDYGGAGTVAFRHLRSRSEHGLLDHRQSVAGFQRRLAAGRQSIHLLAVGARPGHRENEVALPVHAARYARLGRAELARAAGSGVAGQAAETGAARQPQRLFLRAGPHDRRVPERHEADR